MRLNAVLRKIDNRLNPILVKELRQISRGRFLIFLLAGSLLTQLGAAAYVAVAAGGSPDAAPLLFNMLTSFLTIVCALIIPAYAGFRLAKENAELNRDLLFASALKPGAVVWGKTLVCAALAVMVFSVCMPFIFLTFILRGIDLSAAAALLLLSFVFSLLAAQVCILICCLPGQFARLTVGALALLTVFGYLFIADPFLAGGSFSTWGPLNRFEARGMSAALGFLLAWSAMAAMCFLLSTALLSPPASNRALIPRLYATAVWAVSFLAVYVWSRYAATIEPVMNWWLIVCFCFGGALMVSAGERDRWGERTLQTIPRSRWLRPLAFLYYSGSGGGFLWALIGMILSCALASVAAASSGLIGVGDFTAFLTHIGFLFFSFWIASEAALWIHRKFFIDEIPTDRTWIGAFAILMLMFKMVWPIFMSGGGSISAASAPVTEKLLSGYVFFGDPPIAVAGAAALLSAYWSLPRIVRQIAAFKPILQTKNEPKHAVYNDANINVREGNSA